MLLEIELLIRLFISAACGIIIGIERRFNNKQAGMSTFLIVAIASCLFMEISKYGFFDTEKVDAARVAAQVVTGISFLGAGIIVKRNFSIDGLTTAATIWATAGVGLSIGAGLYFLGISCTFIYFFFIFLMRALKKSGKIKFESYKISVSSREQLNYIRQSTDNVKVMNYSMIQENDNYVVSVLIKFDSPTDKDKWEEKILSIEDITYFSSEH